MEIKKENVFFFQFQLGENKEFSWQFKIVAETEIESMHKIKAAFLEAVVSIDESILAKEVKPESKDE